MTPAARAQAAIDILAALEQTRQPLDRLLRDYFRARRYAGSKDRRAIADRVFDVMRHRATFAHRMGDETPRALIIAALAAAGEAPDALFTGGGYAPAPLNDAERIAIGTPARPEPRWVTGEYAQWLDSDLRRDLGESLLPEMQAFIGRAPTDIRVNTLKATREAVIAALADTGIAASPTPYAPYGVRIAGEAGNLSSAPLFESGAFEFQDEAAQIAADLFGAQPGMRVLDLAAGAGGKSLALAAAMNNSGEIVASDVRGEALFELEKRAVRAGATIIRTLPLEHFQPAGLFDAVFVDAPCSGTGTWRRQPELRWRLTPARLAELTALQAQLLDQAAALTRPGGRLFYATCSILAVENQNQVTGFLARTPGFVQADLGQGRSIPGLGMDFRASPARTGTDGFFCAMLVRS